MVDLLQCICSQRFALNHNCHHQFYSSSIRLQAMVSSLGINTYASLNKVFKLGADQPIESKGLEKPAADLTSSCPQTGLNDYPTNSRGDIIWSALFFIVELTLNNSSYSDSSRCWLAAIPFTS